MPAYNERSLVKLKVKEMNNDKISVKEVFPVGARFQPRASYEI